jgi:hypothetical protein
MAKLWSSPLRLAAVGMLSAAVAAFAQNPAASAPYAQYSQANRVAQPGAVNYVEGNASIDRRTITNQMVGTAVLEPKQTLQTAQGKVELLLTPGVFLRLDDNSAVQMVSNSLVDTEVQLQSGRTMIEVDQITPENHLAVLVNGFSTRLDKKGIYQFDANTPSVAVYDGKAVVAAYNKNIDVGKGEQLALVADIKLKTHGFDRKAPNELYAWSKLRSGYMAEANISSAQMIYTYNPWWWYGTGWYWNPWFGSWAFVPGGGLFYGPFGFGFFSPPVVYAYGFHGYPGFGYRGGFRTTPGPAFEGGFHGGGFAGGGFGGRR